MKQKRIISVLIFFAAIVQQSLAQRYFISPEKNGYTLTRSNIIDGLKCDHYEKGSEEVRTFRKSNGDFVTFEEDNDGFNRIPNVSDRSIGSNRITYKDGVVQSCETHLVRGFDENFMIVTLQNGNKLMMNRIISVDYKSFKTPGEFLLDKGDINGITHVNFADNPKVFHRCSNGKITIEQTVYTCDIEGNFVKTSLLFPVEGTNKIIEVHVVESEGLMRIEKDHNGDFIFSYANGDKVIKGLNSENDIKSLYYSFNLKDGTIKHFENGVLKIKNGKWLFYMNDGSIFNGSTYDKYRSFKEKGGIMHCKKITPFNGNIQYANGSVDEIKYGNFKIKSNNRKEDPKQKAQKLKLDYEKLCKMYGKEYVDAAFSGRIMIGMPVKLLTSAFKTILEDKFKHIQQYNVFGWGWDNGGRTLSSTIYTYVVGVSNGKVIEIDDLLYYE